MFLQQYLGHFRIASQKHALCSGSSFKTLKFHYYGKPKLPLSHARLLLFPNSVNRFCNTISTKHLKENSDLANSRMKHAGFLPLQVKIAWSLATKVDDAKWECIRRRMSDKTVTNPLLECDSTWDYAEKATDSEWCLILKRMTSKHVTPFLLLCKSTWSLAKTVSDQEWELINRRLNCQDLGSSPYIRSLSGVLSFAKTASDEDWNKVIGRMNNSNFSQLVLTCNLAWHAAIKATESEWDLIIRRMTGQGMSRSYIGNHSIWKIAVDATDSEWNLVKSRLTNKNLHQAMVCKPAWKLALTAGEEEWNRVVSRLTDDRISPKVLGNEAAWHLAVESTDEQWNLIISRLFKLGPVVLNRNEAWRFAGKLGDEEWDSLVGRIFDKGLFENIKSNGCVWIVLSKLDEDEFIQLKETLNKFSLKWSIQKIIAKISKHFDNLNLDLVWELDASSASKHQLANDDFWRQFFK